LFETEMVERDNDEVIEKCVGSRRRHVKRLLVNASWRGKDLTGLISIRRAEMNGPISFCARHEHSDCSHQVGEEASTAHCIWGSLISDLYRQLPASKKFHAARSRTLSALVYWFVVANPKSPMRGLPATSIKMLSGLRPRWMMPSHEQNFPRSVRVSACPSRIWCTMLFEPTPEFRKHVSQNFTRHFVFYEDRDGFVFRMQWQEHAAMVINRRRLKLFTRLGCLTALSSRCTFFSF
jgi:hypothetical protein